MSSSSASGSVTGSEGRVIGQGRSLICLFPSSAFGSVTGLRQGRSFIPLPLHLAVSLAAGKVGPFVFFLCIWLCHWPQAR